MSKRVLAAIAAATLFNLSIAAPAINVKDAHDVDHLEKRAIKTKVVYETYVIAVDQNNHILTDYSFPSPTPNSPAEAAMPQPTQVNAAPPPKASREEKQETQAPPATSEQKSEPQATPQAKSEPQTSVAPQPEPSPKADSSAEASANAKADGNADANASAQVQSSAANGGDFVDGTIPCNQFPKNVNGIVELPWVGLNGWSSIRPPWGGSHNECVEGAYCSYACKPGMTKTQWPENDQPESGESIGGLICRNGKLYRTRPGHALCENGADTAYIKSSLGQSVYFCQTDYPGSENMVIPTLVEPNSQSKLTVIDQNSSYRWRGKKTSGQFYIQKAGKDITNACVWGTVDRDFGNFSPAVAGVSRTDDNGQVITWMSITINPEAKVDPVLNYNIEIKAENDGKSSTSIECSYINGQVIGGQNGGCTVACKGTCYYHLFPRS